MKNIIFAIFFLFTFSSVFFSQGKARYIAVTIDDLPVVSTRKDLKTRQAITSRLLKHIRKAGVPAIGFVNEGKLYENGKRDEKQVDLLRLWVKSGLELGNHTFSHMSLHDNPLEKYLQDISKGEIITKELLSPKKIRYFRHPYLWTGLNMETKTALGDFLAKNGYQVAPVSIDNADWIFARAYDLAFDKKDKKMMRWVASEYVPYLERKMDYWEKQSEKLFGREIKQILLLHANFINSHEFGKVAKMLKRRGYKFVSLEDALKDEAYRLPDNFTKRNGISWLHRWALGRGKEFILPDEPKVPEMVMKAAGVGSE